MWSPYYKYYQIRKDKNRSEEIGTNYVKSLVSSMEHIEASGILIYKSQNNFPWMTITLIKTNDGNYSIDETTNYERINLIEVITSRRPETNEDWYLKILKNLADELKWEVILEQDDNDNENVLIT